MRLAREFAERCQCDMRHVEQVRRLSLELFDRLAQPLGAQPEERTLLEAAAVLHDVGQLVSYRKRNRHSYELIMHAERLSLSARERPLVAMIARYHRQELPSRKHPEYAALAREDRALVRRLAALLRIADGLDRGYTSVVDKIRTRLTAKRLRIGLVPRNKRSNLALECWGAARRVDLLEELLEREVDRYPRVILEGPACTNIAVNHSSPSPAFCRRVAIHFLTAVGATRDRTGRSGCWAFG